MAEDFQNLSDESLMECVKEHNHQAFSMLVERHAERFYACSYRIVMNREEAEDIVQDAFLKLWDNPHIWKTGKGAKFTSWFYKIVMNLSLDKYRKIKKVQNIDPENMMLETPATQEDGLQKTDEQEGLDKALKTLPEKQFMALNLCFYEQKSRKEAAKLMKVSLKALESLLMRAKQGLKNDLYRQGILQDEKQEGRRA